MLPPSVVSGCYNSFFFKIEIGKIAKNKMISKLFKITFSKNICYEK